MNGVSIGGRLSWVCPIFLVSSPFQRISISSCLTLPNEDHTLCQILPLPVLDSASLATYPTPNSYLVTLNRSERELVAESP
jgi:hypothetical protein